MSKVCGNCQFFASTSHGGYDGVCNWEMPIRTKQAIWDDSVTHSFGDVMSTDTCDAWEQEPGGGGLIRIDFLTTSQTVTIPDQCTQLKVTMVGGGQSGDGFGGMGSGGYTIIKYLVGLTGGNTLTLVVAGADQNTTLASGTEVIGTITAPCWFLSTFNLPNGDVNIPPGDGNRTGGMSGMGMGSSGRGYGSGGDGFVVGSTGGCAIFEWYA